MAILSESARELLASSPLAHVVTVNRDGSPQVSCTWVTVDGDTLVIAVLFERQKIKNLRRDPRISLSVQADSKNWMRLTEYLVIHGRATVEEGGAAELLQKQAHTYIGPEAKFPLMDDPPPGFVIRVHIERIAGTGPWNPQDEGSRR